MLNSLVIKANNMLTWRENLNPTLLRGWPGSTGYQIFVISSLYPPLHPYLLLFVTIRHYSPLFATIRHYSPLFVLFVLFVLFAIRYPRLFAVRYSRLFAIRDYSLFAIRVFQTPSFPSRMRIVLRRERRLKPSSAVFECRTSILIYIPNSSFKQLLGKLDNWSLILFGTSSDPLKDNSLVCDAVVPKRLVKNSGKTGTCVICLFFGMQHIGVW